MTNLKEYKAQWYQRNKERLKQYRLEHKEKQNAYSSQWYYKHRDKVKVYMHNYQEEIKRDVLTHYGGGKCACVRCGESRLACLSIDHIDGREKQHPRGWGGVKIYIWLKQQGYPDGYQTLCMNDQFVKRVENNECARNGRVRKHYRVG